MKIPMQSDRYEGGSFEHVYRHYLPWYLDQRGAAMNPSTKSFTRGEALKRLIVLPSLASFLAIDSISPADASNKEQFKYQDTPGKSGQKCSGCRLFKAPASCQVVTGLISPIGWCVAWTSKS
jgi:hypothetical protein